MSHELPDDLFHVCNELTASGAVPRTYLSDQVYLHTTLKTHKNLVYDVQKLLASQRIWLETSKIAKPARREAIDLADWHRCYVDTQKTSVDSGYAMSLPPGRAEFPVIIGRIPDPDEASGYDWVFDGSHRLYRAWRLGHKLFPAVRLSFAECEAARFDDQKAAFMFAGGTCQQARDVGKVSGPG